MAALMVALGLACMAEPHTAGAQSAGEGSTAQAQGAVSPGAPRASEIGHATSTWLQLQRSGAAAAHEQTMLGAEATLAYQRYLDSFKTKIPATYGSSMDSGYSGNQLHVDYSNSGGAQN
jgi:hypothetical protein